MKTKKMLFILLLCLSFTIEVIASEKISLTHQSIEVQMETEENNEKENKEISINIEISYLSFLELQNQPYPSPLSFKLLLAHSTIYKPPIS